MLKWNQRKGGNMSTETSRNAGTDLIRIHKVITRAITVSNWFSRASGPDQALRVGFQSYERALVISLHAHHLGEDEIAFPFIENRAPETSFNQLRDDHRKIEGLLKEMNNWIEKGSSAWESEALSGLNKVVTKLEKLWYAHITLEEEHIGPKALEHLITPEENIKLGEQIGNHAQQHAQPAELVVPFMLYNMPADDRAVMAQGLPPVVMEQLIPNAWKATWAPMQPFLLD
jgi:iron-sulfur cluster repair protein YtfE (RIC family)